MTPSQRILLVDDSPQDTELAMDALEAEGLAKDVVAVRDGSEALDFLFSRGAFASRAQGQPAVILLDLKMPKLDGFEVLRQVKADGKLQIIPIVVMTSSRQPQDLLNSYQLGANAYVVKPVNFQDFMRSITETGRFWATRNEPPPGSRRSPEVSNGTA